MRKNKDGQRRRLLSRTVRRAIHSVVSGLIGAVVVIVGVFVIVLEQRPDLEPWHTVRLKSEFDADSHVKDYEGYVQLEDRLFDDLERFLDTLDFSDSENKFNRFRRGSPSAPSLWPTNWNRSFELTVSDPLMGVLLIHGMSDSPYSMRNLGERLHKEGAHVIGLRLPGHGTVPSGLVRVEWEDMAGAVELAVRHLREQLSERPVYIVGYSNGGALAVHYALTTLEDDSLAKVDGLILLSPQIGISKLAALAAWQERLGHLLSMRKLAWKSIEPEYDPFKYRSFALNAGKQAHRITNQIQTRITKLESAGELSGFPPVLAFQSALDSTVLAPDLVRKFFMHLPKGGHELVVFDVNRSKAIEFLKKDPREDLDALIENADLSFTVSMVTNEHTRTAEVTVIRRLPGQEDPTETSIGMRWPSDLYSLSHVALPFPPDDPLYGGINPKESPGVHLGDMIARGERGALTISAAEMLRLHWNPFYDYVEQRIVDFVVASDAGSGG